METLRDSISTLLACWCEGLLRHQLDSRDDPSLHGGLMCPDCGFVHGRCGDALYPFLRMASQTNEPKWIEAAVAVQSWSDWVSQPEGSFVNDRPGNPWTGITVFGALALGALPCAILPLSSDSKLVEVDAMSSRREVAASSLRIIAVSGLFWTLLGVEGRGVAL